MDTIIERPETSLVIVNKIIDGLNTLEQCGENYIYFSGEGAMNQTKFERLSNKLKVGVIAHNDLTGRALLHLVRMIIDGHPDLLCYDIRDVREKDEPLTVKALIEYLAESENEYGERFNLGETFTSILYNGDEEITIKKTLSGVGDIWTLERVKKAILRLF